jgi:hypothetical protein
MSGDMTQIQSINNYGQLEEGDLIIIEFKNGKVLSKKVNEVINKNTEKEEVIYNIKKNYYFITSMLLDGTSFVENVSKIIKGKRVGMGKC